MSKYQLLSTISKELKKINSEIDFRIVRGMPYEREARIHKTLISQMNKVRTGSFRSALGFFL